QRERQQICQKRCQMQDSGQQQCQRRCMQQLEQGELDINTSRDPEQKLEQCQQSCQSRQQGQQQQLQQCRQQCAQQLSQRERQQICQRRCQKQDSGQQQCQRRCMQQLEQGELDINTSRDPEQKLEQCQQSCQSRQQGQQQQQQCRQQCAQQLSQRERQQICEQRCQRQERGDQQQKQQCQRSCQQQLEQGQQGEGQNYRREREDQQSRGQSQMNNPYYFPSEMFQQKFRSQEGGMYVLERFTKNENKLLRGIRNYRLAIFEAKPNTFVLPHHCDAESIFVVINGRCTCTMLMQDNKESFNMEMGDVLRVPAGATVYLVNNNNDQTLRIAKLKQPVNTPGRFEEFFPASSQDLDSYFNVFSDDILESAFNTSSDQLQRVFGQQQQRRQGMVMRASPQQLQALSQHASSPRSKGRQSGKGPFNLRNQKPIQANEFGKLFEARPEKFDQLQDMDVSVTCVEVNNEAMMLPHYNSKAIFVVLVVEGSGRVEMACPHMASQSQMGEEEEEEQQQGEQMKVTADVSEGDVFVVPAGHPIAIVAQNNNNDRQNQQLKMLGFGINAQNNKRNFIA
ncbi:vicilin Jug r 2.0101-like, partial [Rosa sericea]